MERKEVDGKVERVPRTLSPVTQQQRMLLNNAEEEKEREGGARPRVLPLASVRRFTHGAEKKTQPGPGRLSHFLARARPFHTPLLNLYINTP